MADEFPPTAPAAAPGATPAAGELRLGPSGTGKRLVLLHGWGADADDLLELGPMLVGAGVEIVALQAPWPHPAGSGRQWYDLQQSEWPQLPEARLALRTRLEQLGRETPLENTLVLGFSQGAAMAIDVISSDGGLPCAGLIGCSGYPHPQWQPNAAKPSAVLLTHGIHDPVVPFAASKALQKQLEEGGHLSQLLRFEGGHTIDQGLFPAMRDFIAAQWPQS
ncbi:alpha/beta hydrolase [Cyanobium sp. WAJ14-Wanaka]|uniref:alpha/beta hydrolase n=1 Tax=Cyanobium sp. WAJ14-Wanaka TaxID=2823725 RepID=UPI0020CC570B|nr:alpha/beta hydrolase [Cyanobium sp. WAJ14-Wanaka]MCP9775823.1 alpha/beta hydrolase [Cyanobium sp. WAJ14-Wanaka]